MSSTSVTHFSQSLFKEEVGVPYQRSERDFIFMISTS